MGNKQVTLHEEAENEANDALDWYLARNPRAAIGFVAELQRAFDDIGGAPTRWPKGSNGTRRFVLRRFPFVVVYRDFPSYIQVLAVAHGSRRPGYWKERL